MGVKGATTAIRGDVSQRPTGGAARLSGGTKCGRPVTVSGALIG